MKIEEQYNKIKQQYNLPDFKQINKLFELTEIECSEELFLVEIRRRIVDKIEYYSKVLCNVLQPDTNLVSIQEAHGFNEEDRKSILTIYKQLMFIERRSNILALDNDDVKTAQFIINTYNKWIEVMPEVVSILEKIHDSWAKEEDIIEDLGYLG